MSEPRFAVGISSHLNYWRLLLDRVRLDFRSYGVLCSGVGAAARGMQISGCGENKSFVWLCVHDVPRLENTQTELPARMVHVSIPQAHCISNRTCKLGRIVAVVIRIEED